MLEITFIDTCLWKETATKRFSIFSAHVSQKLALLDDGIWKNNGILIM